MPPLTSVKCVCFFSAPWGRNSSISALRWFSSNLGAGGRSGGSGRPSRDGDATAPPPTAPGHGGRGWGSSPLPLSLLCTPSALSPTRDPSPQCALSPTSPLKAPSILSPPQVPRATPSTPKAPSPQSPESPRALCTLSAPSPPNLPEPPGPPEPPAPRRARPWAQTEVPRATQGSLLSPEPYLSPASEGRAVVPSAAACFPLGTSSTISACTGSSGASMVGGTDAAPRGWAQCGVRLRVGAAGPGDGVPTGARSAGTGAPAHPRGDGDLPAQVAQPPQQGLAPSLSFPSQHWWLRGGGVGRGRELGDPPLPPLRQGGSGARQGWQAEQESAGL